MRRPKFARRAGLCCLALGGLFAGTTVLGATDVTPVAAAPPTLESGLSVDSNSVMAAARVPYNGNPSSVVVYWGDGNLTVGTAATPSVGTLLFRHEYAPPADGSAFSMWVTVTSGSEIAYRYLTIVPRYLVEKGEDYFSPLNHCDTFLETDTEWHVEQDVYRNGPELGQPIASKHWDFERATGPTVIQTLPVFEPLEGSGFSYEMTMADPGIFVWTLAAEVDLFLDDQLYGGYGALHPSMGSRLVSAHLGEFSGDCLADIHAYVSVTLLEPSTAIETLPIPPAPTPPPSDPTPPRCQGNPRNCQEQ